MKRTISAGALALGLAGLPVATWAQVDALATALNHCNDPSRPADARIRDCTEVIAAQGIDSFDTAAAWLDLGLAYQALGGDRQRELDAYSKAIALEPDLWQARVNRVQLYLEAGDGDRALADYRALRAGGPGNEPMYRAKANMEYRTVKLEGATTDRSDMDSPAREQATYANAMESVGRALQQGFAARCRMRALAGLELDAALKDCDTAIELNATDDIAHQARGIAEFRRADWPAALAEFNLVLSRQPDTAEALYMKGTVEHRMGNPSAGDTDIAAAKAIDSRVAAAYAQYGILP